MIEVDFETLDHHVPPCDCERCERARNAPEIVGHEIIAAGYFQLSAKYRCLARTPPGETAIEAISRHDPTFLEKTRRKIEEEIESRAASTYRREYAHLDDNAKTLTPAEFQAFKKAGGVPDHPCYDRENRTPAYLERVHEVLARDVRDRTK